MTDITPNIVVSQPSQLFTLARSFKANANGKIYIGKIDTDPVNQENQIQVYVENEDGSHVPVSQPIIINAAGYPVYNGQIAKFVTVQGHSMAVYDASGSQQFYYPNVLKYDPDQLRQELSSNSGANLIGTSSGNTVQQEINKLYSFGYSYGVRLSSYMQENDPLTSALNASRSKKLPLIIDCDATYKTFLVYSNDRIIGCGEHTLTKLGNDKPSIPSAQQPERPAGVVTNFNVDAGIIVVHGDTHARNIIIIDINIKTSNHSEYGIYAPCIQYSSFSKVRMDGFKKAIRCKDAFMNKFDQIFSIYYYNKSDMYSDNFAYDFSDDIYASGTSNTFSNVNCVNYKWPFYFREHNYSTLTSCGGEGVKGTTTPSSIDMPRVFEFKNCTSIVLNTPFTENMYGSFLRVTNDNSSIQNKGAGTVVVNGAQAITGIFGTSNDVGAKLIDVGGTSSVIMNGGVIVAGALGYYLKFGGAKDDSYLSINGTDLSFCIDAIKKDIEIYSGMSRIYGRMPFQCIINGVSSSSTNVVSWKTTKDDEFNMRTSSNFIKIPLGGWYNISASVTIGESHSDGSIIISLSDTPSDSGEVIATRHIVNSTTLQSASIDAIARIPSGKYVYIRVINATSNPTINDVDAYFRVTQQ